MTQPTASIHALEEARASRRAAARGEAEGASSSRMRGPLQIDTTPVWRGIRSVYFRTRMIFGVILICAWGGLVGSAFWFIMQMLGVHFGARP